MTAETVFSLPHKPPSPADDRSPADHAVSFSAAAVRARGDWASAAQLYRAFIATSPPLAQPSPVPPPRDWATRDAGLAAGLAPPPGLGVRWQLYRTIN